MAAITDINHTFITKTDRVVYPVSASVIIYAGVFLGEDSGTRTARPLVAGDKFLGISTEYVDNSSGLAADKNVEVKIGEHRLLYNVGGFGGSNYVYASDDNTLTLTDTGNTLVGSIIRRWINNTTLCEVLLDTKIQIY